jgi:adenylosuccinate lyase
MMKQITIYSKKEINMSTDRYTSPLSERYASKEMQYIFSQDMKFKTWRRLWIALAETEMELGLSENGKPVITQEQIDELKAHVDDINYDVAREREKLVRHDVMSHVYAYGQQCPKAAGIIHLGATSCYVGDNTDIIVMNEALKLVHKKLVNVINELAKFADKYKNLPTLAFTHFQPAQPTTVGKRATLWTQEFIMDLEDLEYVMGSLKLLGSKGTTGTQASFLELFNGDQETIDKIDPTIAAKMGFKECYAVSGQTYSRKVDTRVANILAGIAASAHKMSNDIRLLQHLKEVEEPFEKNQIGSSAMAYKRNPMRSERIASLSRYVMVDALNPAITSATQWFERTLDDSANKRLSIPEGFLAIDGILDLCLNVVDGLVVYDKVITKHMMAELPFMATENIMMDAVKNGGNRQELHEKIRQLSMEAGKNVKVEGKDNNLLELIAADPSFNLTLEELQATMEPSKYVGRAPIQVDKFLANVVNPILEANKEDLGMTAEINV